MSRILTIAAAFVAGACMLPTAYAQNAGNGGNGGNAGGNAAGFQIQNNRPVNPEQINSAARDALGPKFGVGSQAGFNSIEARRNAAFTNQMRDLHGGGLIDPHEIAAHNAGLTGSDTSGGSGTGGDQPPAPPSFFGGGGGHGPMYGNAYTMPGDVIRSSGEAIRSMGEGSYWYGRGLEHMENAESMALDNELREVQTFWQKRQIRDSYMALENPRPSLEAIVRMAKIGLPDRLTASDIDPATGKLVWPAILLQPEFAADRAAVEEVFAMRQRGEIDANDPRLVEAHQRIERMTDTLVADVDRYDAKLYLQARNLLDTLRYESSLPAGPANVARR